jgi:hypothetical protein
MSNANLPGGEEIRQLFGALFRATSPWPAETLTQADSLVASLGVQEVLASLEGLDVDLDGAGYVIGHMSSGEFPVRVAEVIVAKIGRFFDGGDLETHIFEGAMDVLLLGPPEVVTLVLDRTAFCRHTLAVSMALVALLDNQEREFVVEAIVASPRLNRTALVCNLISEQAPVRLLEAVLDRGGVKFNATWTLPANMVNEGFTGTPLEFAERFGDAQTVTLLASRV